MPSLDTLIPRFKAADRSTRLETLLDYSRKLPALPERLEDQKGRAEHRVHECQTPVFLWVEVEGGQVHIHADVPRESPTVGASSRFSPAASMGCLPRRSPGCRTTCSISSA